MIFVPSEADIAVALGLAIERGELFMLYQPKIAIGTGKLAGVEALMRWQSPQFGLVLPSTFIPVGERSGGVDEISDWGLRTALRQWTGWAEQGIRTNIAFNLSASTLRDLRFPDLVQRLCQATGVPCDQLTIEVSEGTSPHMLRLLDIVTRFRIKGMAVQLDDFGIGYSSLLQLKDLPYTGVKIDHCFIRDLAVNREAQLIVRAMIDLAHALELTTTAEGIEDRQTLDILGEFGCDHAQGFLLSPPLKPSELAPWVLGASARKRPDAPSLQLETVS
jgi:EAL domain-containing protein (putative c-di-GMP-specific phosphodiesterase class I)